MRTETLNRVELTGFLGSVNIKELGGGRMACFTVITETVYEYDGSSFVEKSYHRCETWDTTMGFGIIESSKPGDLIKVTGRIKYQKFTDINNVERTETRILATKIEK